MRARDAAVVARVQLRLVALLAAVLPLAHDLAPVVPISASLVDFTTLSNHLGRAQLRSL